MKKGLKNLEKNKKRLKICHKTLRNFFHEKSFSQKRFTKIKFVTGLTVRKLRKYFLKFYKKKIRKR